MKKLVLIFLIFISILNSQAQQLNFSDSAKISLITCSPGEEVYEKFGHTAIRINDKKTATDLVFNYGIFDFNTSNFYFKFIKGETDYQLGVYDTGNFLASYAMRNSLVWEQIINLTVSEKRILINNLLRNYEPENRTYRYNFVFDNCATRPRDKIMSSTKGYIKFLANSEPKTYRQWIGSYIGSDTWLKFGIDLVFGIEAEHFASTSESMFLPEVLMSEFQTAQIVIANGQTKKLIVDKKILINKHEATDINSNSPFKPLTITILILIIGSIITIWDIYQHRHSKLFDSILFISTGILGIIIAYLMFFSVQPLVKQNLNIVWLNPLSLIVGILIWFRRLRVAMFFYQILNIIFLVGGLFAFALSIQSFNVASFPIIVLLLMRSTSWFAYLKRRIYKHRSL